jgi:transcriptional accessory protein Tex/SPT6
MKLEKLILIANAGYPDADLVYRAYKEQKKKKPDQALVGDGLAWFIAEEITETYDAKARKEDQLNEALRVITRAEEELNGVKQALFGAL